MNAPVSVTVGLPAAIAALLPTHVLSAVAAEIDELAAELSLPLTAAVAAELRHPAGFTLNIEGRSCRYRRYELAVVHLASVGWDEQAPLDPAEWMVGELSASPTSDVVTTWFRVWVRAVLGSRPEVLVTDTVVEHYRSKLEERDARAARLLISHDCAALVLRTVVGRRVAVPVDGVVDALVNLDGDGPVAHDPAAIGESLVYALRPELVTVHLAPDLPRRMVSAMVESGGSSFAGIRSEFCTQWGLPAPRLRVVVDDTVPQGVFHATINSVRTINMPVPPAGTLWTTDLGAAPGGPTGLRSVEWLQFWVRRWMWQAAVCFVEKWTVERCLLSVEDSFPMLNAAFREWTELGPAAIGLARLIRQFVLEGQPVTNMRLLLDHLVDRAAECEVSEADPFASSRQALSQTIGARVLRESAELPVVQIGDDIESDLVASAVGWTAGLPPTGDMIDVLVDHVERTVGQRRETEPGPIVLCQHQPAVVAQALHIDFPTAIVARMGDLPDVVRERLSGYSVETPAGR